MVLWRIFFPNLFSLYSSAAFLFLINKFGFFYILSVAAFVSFCIWIGFFSKYKTMKLGDDDAVPEYSFWSWVAMLFSAGMGIGLVFWAVAEPLNYFVSPLNAEPGSPEAFRFAMNKSFLHWGLHPWAIYAILALALAFVQFRFKKPALVSSIFIPFIGEEKAKSFIGKSIDALSVCVTVIGVATSLGLGALQINSGLKFLFNINENPLTQVIIIIFITFLFLFSALTGIDRGIKILSNINIAIAILVALLCFFIGPTARILSVLVQAIGEYVNSFISNGMEMGAYSQNKWYGSWTVFYWAWWISWTPFCGTFIARISKGRTIKEFMTGVLLVPSVFSFVWFAIFGTLAINRGLDIAKDAIASVPTALFVILRTYPFGYFVSIIVVILLVTFFITSADSATFVLGIFSSGGSLEPSVKSKLVWGGIQSALAIFLMLGTKGGLEMVQIAAIVVAFPFVFIMIFSMFSIVKMLKKESLRTVV